MYLWPYVEQDNLVRRSTSTPSSSTCRPATIGNTLNGMTGAKVPLYYCPSDAGSDLDSPSAYYQRRRGNYVVNWGNAQYDTAAADLAPPFDHVGGNRSNARSSPGSPASPTAPPTR